MSGVISKGSVRLEAAVDPMVTPLTSVSGESTPAPPAPPMTPAARSAGGGPDDALKGSPSGALRTATSPSSSATRDRAGEAAATARPRVIHRCRVRERFLPSVAVRTHS
jgi:hypothetical protein